MKMSEKKNYDKLIKILQIVAGIFIVCMIIAVLIIMKVKNISVSNPSAILAFFEGYGVVAMAAMIILVNLVKSFAFVVTPSIMFVVSGILFRDVPNGVWIAILVNFIATEIAMIPTYYLGRFTGSSMINTLKNRFPKVKKIDDFAGQNEIILSCLLKATGLIPGDLTSLVLGAMNISFVKYFIGASLGTLPINIMWAVLGNKGSFSDPKSALYVIPIIVFVVAMAVIVKIIAKKKNGAVTAEEVSAEEETAE